MYGSPFYYSLFSLLIKINVGELVIFIIIHNFCVCKGYYFFSIYHSSRFQSDFESKLNWKESVFTIFVGVVPGIIIFIVNSFINLRDYSMRA